MHTMKKRIALWALACSLLMAGCAAEIPDRGSTPPAADGAAGEAQSIELFAMDTVMSLTAYGSHAQAGLSAAQQEIERLDALFSISSPTGDVLPLNQNHTGVVSADTKTLLTRALDLAASTGGAFDCTIAPIMEAWGFTTGEYRVPPADELRALLPLVDHRQVQLAGDTVTLPDGAALDLGGIAKGFTSSRVMEVFAEQGVESGIISLGGNVQTLGCKPDGSRWRVGIQDPHDTEELFAIVEVADEAVITSGGYQRYFEQDGVRYHHIIDPHTGEPAQSGLCSVTIVSRDGTLADGLSTALFVMGLERATDYWRAHVEGFDMVLMDEAGDVYITPGLDGRLTLQNGGAATVLG